MDLASAWHHAAKAMLCTSATTCFSFVANATSSFPAIYTFVLWCCSLIIVNYCSVNTLYLAAVAVYDTHLAKKKICPRCIPCVTCRAIGEGQVDESKGVASPTANSLEQNFFRFIHSFRLPLVLVWVVLFVVSAMCAAQLQPDPDAPKLLPASDPYMQWTDTLVEHFGALDNPKLITAKLVFGIDRESPIDREGTNAADVTDRGAVNWSGLLASDAKWQHAQTWLDNLCSDLERKSEASSNRLKISASSPSGGAQIKCIWSHLRQWATLNGQAWPAPTFRELESMTSMFLRSSDVQNPQDTNYERWSGNMFFVNDDSQPYGVVPKFFTIDVKLTMQADSLYEDGLDLWEEWEAYCEHWRGSAPLFLQKGFYFTDVRQGSGAFHWFFLQSKITSEAFIGMALALGFACAVLLIATGNVVVPFCAIANISYTVASVMAFMYLVGWKLGVIEALVLVMVIGLSVDYVVHLADAYLEAPAQDRFERTKFMIVRMGRAVVNGAMSTLGAAGFMCGTYIIFFQKFGVVILVTVFQSVITSLFFFSAMMALVGPQGTFGNIAICQGAKFLDRCQPSPHGSDARHTSPQDPPECEPTEDLEAA